MFMYLFCFFMFTISFQKRTNTDMPLGLVSSEMFSLDLFLKMLLVL